MSSNESSTNLTIRNLIHNGTRLIIQANNQHLVISRIVINVFANNTYQILISPSSNEHYVTLIDILRNNDLLQPDLHDVLNNVIRIRTINLETDVYNVIRILLCYEPRLYDTRERIAQCLNLNIIRELPRQQPEQEFNLPDIFWTCTIQPILRSYSYGINNNYNTETSSETDSLISHDISNDSRTEQASTLGTSSNFRLYTPAEILKPGLNNTQKNILQGYLAFAFADIQEFDCIDDQIQLLGVFAKKNTDLNLADIECLEKFDFAVEYRQLQRILDHPCPQNRSEDYPYFGKHQDSEKYVVYKDKSGRAAFEERGLLGLTSRLDDKFGPPTKQQVCDYIVKLIEDEKDKYTEQKQLEVDKSILWLNDDKKRTLSMIVR